MSFGPRWVAPILPDFFRRYPDIAVDLHLSDDKVDLIGDGRSQASRRSYGQSLSGRCLPGQARCLALDE
jgi:DNA-binding transcriptional LysR family regulator